MAKLMAAPSREILEAALTGLEAQRDKIDQQISQVRTMLGGKARAGKAGRPVKTAISHPLVSDAFAAEPRKRVLSPEARKRIATAQKKRWAAFRKTNS
jgi:hypothetical protein